MRPTIFSYRTRAAPQAGRSESSASIATAPARACCGEVRSEGFRLAASRRNDQGSLAGLTRRAASVEPAPGLQWLMMDAAPHGPSEIPDKLYFRIGEVAELLGVEPYVLRYWESEFPLLSPKKSGAGHRLYRRKDVELLLRIKQLLYEKRFTIQGARQWLQTERRPRKARPAGRSQRELFADDPVPEIRRELAEILEMLK